MSTTPEDAVRRYLAWVDDPSAAIDQDAIEAAESELASATDPIAKLHAAAAVERAKATDASALEDDFVTHAKAYADRESIPAAAFTALGVGQQVLARAGFEVAGGGTRPRQRAASSGPRSAQVPVSKLKAVALQMPKRFTLAQLAERAGGGSPATVRKAVEELIGEGRATSVGPAPDHSGPGRAPTLYELS